MARVTVEDCVDNPEPVRLVLMAAQRARRCPAAPTSRSSATATRNPVVALREIAEQTVKPRELEEAIVANLQKVRLTKRMRRTSWHR